MGKDSLLFFKLIIWMEKEFGLVAAEFCMMRLGNLNQLCEIG